MIILVIAGLVLSISAPQEGGAFFSPGVCALATWAISLLSLPLGLALSNLLRRRASLADMQQLAVRTHRTLLLYHLFLLAGFAVSLHVLGWRTVCFAVYTKCESILLVELLCAAPFLLSVAMSWYPSFLMGSAVRSGEGFLRKYVGFQVRTTAISVAPWFLFLSLLDLVRFLPSGLQDLLFIYPFLQWAMSGVLLAVLFLLSPFLLKIAWAPRSMPNGPLRERIESFCRRLGLGYRDILVWDTGRGAVNAGVTGFISRLRYILMSDAMLEQVPPDEIEAVLGHETGHAVYMHIPWYALLCLGYLCLSIAAKEFFVVESGEGAQTVMLLLSFFLYWGGLFGFVSRRFERQADIFSAHAVGSFSTAARALERVAVLNGHMHRVFSWRHFSIEKRVRFLLRAEQDPSVVRRFRAQLRGILAAITILLLAGLVGVSRVASRQIEDPSGRLAILAEELLKGEDYAAAQHYAKKAIDSSPRSKAYHHALLGNCFLAAGEESSALSEYRIALHLTEGESDLRHELVRIIKELTHKDS